MSTSLLLSLHRKSREKKYRLFLQLIRPLPETRILNVGVAGVHSGLADQFESFYPYHERITGGGISPVDVGDYRRSFPRANALLLDGCALPFPDRSFDVVFSNAVIEHLPDRESQRRFAEEVQRVGRGWFVTTPNVWYPVEPHYHLPLVQFLPQAWQRVTGCRVTFYAETLVAFRAPS